MSTQPTILKDELRELAELAERATGPARGLDALIRCAVFAPEGAFVRQSPVNGAWCVYEVGSGGKERLWEPRGLSQLQRVGSFTESLDAAMQLVPEGCLWTMDSWSTAGWSAGVWKGRSWAVNADRDRQSRTPALALTAAALRARATFSTDTGER